jgi:hypothetical protein
MMVASSMMDGGSRLLIHGAPGEDAAAHAVSFAVHNHDAEAEEHGATASEETAAAASSSSSAAAAGSTAAAALPPLASSSSSLSPSSSTTGSVHSSSPPRASINAQKLGPSDFTFGAELGEGAFAKVVSCVRCTGDAAQRGRRYACKIVDKAFIQRMNKVNTVLNEKKILSLLDGHEGIVQLAFTFQDAHSLCTRARARAHCTQRRHCGTTRLTALESLI